MATQPINRSQVSVDDLLLTLAEASAHTALTVETLRQRAERRPFRTVKGNDGLVGLHRSSRDITRLAAMRSTSQPVQRAVADQVASPGNVAILERTAALLREQVKLIARLSEELAEERRRRNALESVTADLQGQLAELERNLCAATSGLGCRDDGTAGTAQETRALAEMEDQAREWRKRSRSRPRSARRWLRRSMRRLLARLFNRRPPP